MNRGRLRASLAGLLMLAPTLAIAQAPPTPAKRDSLAPNIEISAGVSWSTPVKLNATGAIEKTPNGSDFTLFNSSGTERGPAGVEASMAFRLNRHLLAEVTGEIGPRKLQTSISSDFEGAPAITLTQPFKRYMIEGSGTWLFGRRSKVEPFVRGGAGWMRQITDDKILVADSVYVVVGGGIRYWVRDRFGLRVDARAIDRIGEVTFGTKRLSGIIAGGVIFGF